MEATARIHIAVRQPLMRFALDALCQQQPAFGPLSLASELDELEGAEGLLRYCQSEGVQVLVIDDRFAGLFNTIENSTARETLLRAVPTVLISAQSPEWIYQIHKVGMVALLTTESLLQEITEAIYAAAKGVRFFSPAVVDILIQQTRQLAVGGRPTPQENLSERETEILTLVAEGRSSREIAEQLHLSHHTINTHRKNILKKLACKSAAELMNYAYSKGLIEKH
jgi:DNA-binding NarL/FixJ family response regulator